MKIGRYKVKANCFAFDGCHKIYILESENDIQEAKDLEYEILPISKVIDAYYESCGLRFISNWQLNKDFARQFKNAKFTQIPDKI